MFWVNNDHDVPAGTELFGNPLDHDVEAFANQPTSQDWFQGYITCVRGLEDFARLWVCGVPSLPASQGYTVTLSCNDISGSPALNLYTAEAGGGIGYLTNSTVAQTLVNETKLGTISSGSTYIFPDNFFDGTNKCFLFEGAGAGKGELVLTIYHGSDIVAQTWAYLDLHDVKDLYEQARITNVQTNWPQMVDSPTTSSFQIEHKVSAENAGSEKQLVVFVHGWRITHWAYYNFAETMFKRLYWQGFNGRFAALYWPTLSADTFGTDPLAQTFSFLTFNRSEHVALDSGVGAASYLDDLRQRFPDFTISVCSHSQGADVMAEALKELAAVNQKPIQNYVMMQGAFTAQSYDPNVTNYQDLLNREAVVPTPNTYLSYAQKITNAVLGKIINYFNPQDYALALWNQNQLFFMQQTNNNVVSYLTMKPDVFWGYQTDGANAWLTNNVVGQLLATTPRVVTNILELMPFVARPRSLAVGEQAGVGGAVNGGELNLQTQFGFTDAYYDHSGEFNRSIQEPEGNQFYFRLLRALRTGVP